MVCNVHASGSRAIENKCAAAADSAQAWRRSRVRLSSRRTQATATLLRVLRAVETDTAGKGESSAIPSSLFPSPFSSFYLITPAYSCIHRSLPAPPEPPQSGSAFRSFWLMRTAVLAMEDRKRSVPHEPSDDSAPPLKRQALQSSSSSNPQNNHQLPQSQEDVIVSCCLPLHPPPSQWLASKQSFAAGHVSSPPTNP